MRGRTRLRLIGTMAMLAAVAAACQRTDRPDGRAATPQAARSAAGERAAATPQVVGTPTPTPRPLPVVSGEIFFQERIVLPSDAMVRVRVVQLGAAAAPRPVIAERTFAAPRRLPIPFTLECDPQALERGAAYGVEVAIARRGKVEFTTVEPAPVLAGGQPTTGLKVLVRRTR